MECAFLRRNLRHRVPTRRIVDLQGDIGIPGVRLRFAPDFEPETSGVFQG